MVAVAGLACLMGAGLYAVRVVDRTVEIRRKCYYHRMQIETFTRDRDDPAELQRGATMAGQTPDDIRTWYSRRIAWHAAMLPKWERATPWFSIEPDLPSPD
jgi:hypothetical protein